MSRSWVIGVFVVLAATVVMLIWHKSRKEQGIEDIIPEGYSKIDRVQIVGSFDTLLFERIDSVWYYGAEQLSTRAVKNLILTSANLSMKSIVPFEDIGRPEFAADFMFMFRGKEAGHFTFQKSDGGYYIYEAQDDYAYGVELVGYEDYALEKIFSTELDHYRDHLLVSLLPVEIKRIEIDPLEGEAFLVKDEPALTFMLQDSAKDLSHCADTMQVRMLFSFFNALRYDRQIAPKSIEDQINSELPEAIIRVVDRNDSAYRFEVFPWYNQGNGEPDMFKCIVRYNNNNSAYYIMNYYYLDLLLRNTKAYLNDCD
ncbi:MAG TPA: hypothetical protein VJ951_03225 [Bacteroidales bacterium]|nr:hypothetical protein [Bacteroidales bacterium]